MIEIDEHHHSRFGRHSGERDEPDRNGHGPVVAERPDKPEAADHGERQREHDDQCFTHAAEVEIQQKENDRERGRDDHTHGRLGAEHVLILSAPDQAISLRQHDLAGDGGLRFRDVSPDVTARHVHIHPGGGLRPFGPNDHRTCDGLDCRDLSKRDLRHTSAC